MTNGMFDLSALLTLYFKRFPEDRPALRLLTGQVAAAETMNDRTNYRGHITAAAIVLSPDRRKVLLIYHSVYDRWLQPGGHWEIDEADPLLAARREAIEETGVHIDRYLPLDPAQPLLPIQIESHHIAERPARNEPVHYHHDFRYVFVAASYELQPDGQEAAAVDWVDLDDRVRTEHVNAVLRRVKQYPR